MRKPKNSPFGFDLWHGSDSGDSIWLPISVLAELDEEKARKLKEEVAALHAKREKTEAEALNVIQREAHEASRSKVKEILDAARDDKAFDLSLSPCPGFYRVLPKFHKFLQKSPSETADKEVQAQRTQIRDRLRKTGPDRLVAKPDDWQGALADLVVEMPNFSEPIELVRNTLSLSEASMKPLRIPPMLLLGPPGVGKTLFSQRLAEILGAPHAALAFDQPSSGSQLRGSEKYWSNSEPGILFNLICLGDCANPVVLLDEIDKADHASVNSMHPLAQLHSALEVQTAATTVDASTDVEFDAGLVTYIATANSLTGIGLPLLSRFESFRIDLPDRHQAVGISERLAQRMVDGLGLIDRVQVDRRAHYVLSALSPRVLKGTLHKLFAAAVQAGEPVVTADHVWRAIRIEEDGPRLH